MAKKNETEGGTATMSKEEYKDLPADVLAQVEGKAHKAERSYLPSVDLRQTEGAWVRGIYKGSSVRLTKDGEITIMELGFIDSAKAEIVVWDKESRAQVEATPKKGDLVEMLATTAIEREFKNARTGVEFLALYLGKKKNEKSGRTFHAYEVYWF